MRWQSGEASQWTTGISPNQAKCPQGDQVEDDEHLQGPETVKKTGSRLAGDPTSTRYLSTGKRVKNWYTTDPWTKGTPAYNDMRAVRRGHVIVRRKANAMSPEELTKAATIENSLSPTRDIVLEDFRSGCPVTLPGQCPFAEKSKSSVQFLRLHQCEMACAQGGFFCLVVLHPEALGIHGVTDQQLDDFSYQVIHFDDGLSQQVPKSYPTGQTNHRFNNCNIGFSQHVPKNITPEFEHMMRCLTIGTGYFLTDISYEVSLLYFAELMDIDMPRLRSSLSYSDWIRHKLAKFLMYYAMRVPQVKNFLNWKFHRDLNNALNFSSEKHAELQEKSDKVMKSAISKDNSTMILSQIKVKIPLNWNELNRKEKSELVHQWARNAFPKVPESLITLTVGLTVDGDSGRSIDEEPEWLDREKFARGQKFAQENLFGVFFSILFALFGLYSFEEGLNPLIITGKSSEPYSAFKRSQREGKLLEVKFQEIVKDLCFKHFKTACICNFCRYLSTGARFRNWYTSDLWTKGTSAYNDIRTVRRVHEIIRNKVTAMTEEETNKATKIKHPWSPTRNTLVEDFKSACPAASPGQCPFTMKVPGVNLKKMHQGEMAMTQGGFVGLVVLFPEALGIHGATDKDLEDYFYVWRCIGYLLGIEDEFNFCRGTCEEIKQRSRDYLDAWVKPNLRDLTLEWEHMMRVMIAGAENYAGPGSSFERSIFYFAELMDIDMPQFRSLLSYRDWISHYFLKFMVHYAMRFSAVRKFMNAKMNTVMDTALQFSNEKHVELQEKSSKLLASAFPHLPESLLSITIGSTVDGDSGISIDEIPEWLDRKKFLRGQKFAQDNLLGIMATALLTLSWYTSDPWTKGTHAYKDMKIVRQMHVMIRNKLHAMSDESIDKATTIKNSWSPTRDILLEDFRSACPVALPGQCPFLMEALGSIRLKKLNQGEMALTQGSFVCLVVTFPTAFGIHGATDENLENFCYVWKGIGYLLGIEDAFNFCNGSLEEIKKRSEDYLNEWVKPNLRDISPEWEHMIRCLFDGIQYFIPGISYEMSLLYVMELMNIDMPRLRSTLSNSDWIRFYLLK
ncbi:Protein of unknown function [Cotesia congregata]|uniref:ER-bound oxygenase mpaB/mpaB'/Rubber oxygenase catalytic domain-containing protein n=1 Tax=Cotesia congregata TaxID=51543 RepID=A0A8J2MB83_COTCN|nr:Protein of unknown function [Cotesia congregata]